MKFLSRPEEIILLAVFQLKENAYCVPIRKKASVISGKEPGSKGSNGPMPSCVNRLIASPMSLTTIAT